MLIHPPKLEGIDVPEPATPPGILKRILWRIGARTLGLYGVNDILMYVGKSKLSCPHQAALDFLEVELDVPAADLDHIPREGPVLVVANHPFGGIDGIALCAAVRQVRTDITMLTNFMLMKLPKLRDDYLPLNPFETGNTTNGKTVRESIRRLRGGHVVCTFPAGEVSHVTWRHWSVTDPKWMTSIALLAQRGGATVIPMFVHGRNSLTFQLAGLVHPIGRTMLLARQLNRQSGRRISLSIGRPIMPDKIAEFTDRDLLTQYLRGRVYMLSGRRQKIEKRNMKALPPKTGGLLPEITVADRCADEVMTLLPKQRLIDSGNLTVYLAKSRQIPHILREIGRLREVTFREVGEGTGNEVDLDRFDRSYRHLFLWNHETQEVVGAYRLGLSDEIMRTVGVKGLYTYTLFNYDERLLERLGPAVELGRSFIRSEYQRSFKPLMLLWRGISRFICLKPKYRYFFGVVSISNDYAVASKRLMTDFVSSTRMVNEFQGLVSPRNPHQPKQMPHWDLEPFRHGCNSLEDVEELVRDIENERQGVPILLKQYLKLNAKLITVFNVDKEFSNVIDGLMLVDFLDVDRRMLNWYFGKDEAAEFLRFYGRDPEVIEPDDDDSTDDRAAVSA